MPARGIPVGIAGATDAPAVPGSWLKMGRSCTCCSELCAGALTELGSGAAAPAEPETPLLVPACMVAASGEGIGSPGKPPCNTTHASGALLVSAKRYAVFADDNMPCAGHDMDTGHTIHVMRLRVVAYHDLRHICS